MMLANSLGFPNGFTMFTNTPSAQDMSYSPAVPLLLDRPRLQLVTSVSHIIGATHELHDPGTIHGSLGDIARQLEVII
jgi:hypothetical protein